MAKTGRPTIFTKKLGDAICAELAEGISLRTVCEKEKMPSASTVFKWLRENDEFSQQYARAKQESSDAMAEDIIDISDDGRNDWMQRKYGDTMVWIENGEALQRSKLRVETRKWLMAKMKPKKYGEKVDVTSDGKAIKGNQIIFTDFKDEAAGK